MIRSAGAVSVVTAKIKTTGRRKNRRLSFYFRIIGGIRMENRLEDSKELRVLGEVGRCGWKGG